MSRIRSQQSRQRPAPLGNVQPKHAGIPGTDRIWIIRDFPLSRAFADSDYFPTNVDADIRALRNWERRRDELLADLPDEGGFSD